MISISFRQSRSVRFKEVLKIAKEFPSFSDENGRYYIRPTYLEIFENWERFLTVFTAIWHWTSTIVEENNAILKDKKLSEFFYTLQEVNSCYKNYSIDSFKEQYCVGNCWPCHKINSVQLLPVYYGTLWYKSGHFENGYSVWVIQKENLKRVLETEIYNRRLFTCPAFSKDRVMKIIDDLPDKINLQGNSDWEIEYEKRFIGSKIKDVPVGISHVIREEDEDFRNSEDESKPRVIDDSESENPFTYGTDEWANWIIEQYKIKHNK